MLESFTERHKAQYIYDTYFDPNSEHDLSFVLVDTLAYYGALNKEDGDRLLQLLDKCGDGLWQQMKQFDEQQLNKQHYTNNFNK